MEDMPAVSSRVEKNIQIPLIRLALRPRTIRHPDKCSKLENDAICGLGHLQVNHLTRSNMQHSRLNRATIRVANTTEVSGRVTGESVKRGFFSKKQSDLSRRVGGLTIFAPLVLVIVLTALAPISTHAAPGGVPAEIAELKARASCCTPIAGASPADPISYGPIQPRAPAWSFC